MQKAVEYHNNPVNPRWNLAENPEDYKYSSAKFYYKGIDEFVRRGGYLKTIWMYKGGSFMKGSLLLVAKKFVKGYFLLENCSTNFLEDQHLLTNKSSIYLASDKKSFFCRLTYGAHFQG